MPVITEGETHRGPVEAATERNNDFTFTWAIEAGTPPDRELLGGKGAGLVEMKTMDLPVPPGFILTTEACHAHYDAGDELPSEIWSETVNRVALLEKETGLGFGDRENPLIVSGRGGACKSMPGILTSVLNIGLNKNTVQGLTELEGEWCAWDSLLRAHQSYGVGIRNMKPDDFNGTIKRLQKRYDAATRQDLPVEALKEAVEEYEKIVALPSNPYDHLQEAIEAVFKSWNKPEAIAYREEDNIPHDWGTAVNIVQMIFGNKPQDGFAGSGVLFTRHPDTGEDKPHVAYIAGAQGTDIVGPESVHQLIPLDDLPPAISKPLHDGCQILAQNYPHPQESEWTHNGKGVYWLQTRDASLSSRAEFEIHFEPWREQVEKGLITMEEATSRFLEAPNLHDLGPSEALDPYKVSLAQEESRVLRGIPISPGIGIGVAVNSLKLAEKYNALPEPVSVVLLRESPAELNLASLPPNVSGVATRFGGAGSHMAQKFRGCGFPLVFGLSNFDRLSPGMEINLDATNGLVIIGQPMPVVKQHVHLPVEVREYLEKLQQILEANSWLRLTYATKDKQRRPKSLAQRTLTNLERLQSKWQSPKTWGAGLIERMVPAEERIQTKIFTHTDEKRIRALLHVWQDGEYDTSLRTCHFPEPRIGTAPWRAFNDLEEIDEFFDGGDYSTWQEDKTLSEIIAGRNHKGKLYEGLAEQHYVFSVSATTGGVIVQINPHTPQTRDWDKINPEKIITIRMPVNPLSKIKLGKISVQIGKDIQDDPLSKQAIREVIKTVFGRWWQPPFALPNLMAALNAAAGLNTLEGQLRIDPEGEKSWGPKVFGVKGEKA